MPHNLNMNDISIKTEPLSPLSAEQLMNHIAPSLAPQNTLPTSPGPGLGLGAAGEHSPGPATLPSTDARSALKSSILTKRKLRGETTLPYSNEDRREYKLTKRDIERREARKEQNRRAARKCRIKKKSLQENAEMEMATARKENVEMRHEVLTLRQQIVHLQQIISDHEMSQNCRLSPPSSHSTPCNARLQSVTATSTGPIHGLPGPMAPIGVNSNTSYVPFHNANLQEIVLPEIPAEKTPLESFLSTVPESPSYLNNSTVVDNTQDDTVSGQWPDLPSWDLNNLIGDFDQEVPDAVIESLRKDLYETEAFETPKTDAEMKIIEKLSFSCPVSTETPNTFISNKTTNAKPAVVRNLNQYFTQNDVKSSVSKPQHHQQHHIRKNAPPPLTLVEEPKANDFLLDPNLSSPILSCVSPNLVQQLVQSATPQTTKCDVHTSDIQLSNPRTSTSTTSCSFSPFENQVITQNVHSVMRIEPRDSNETGLFEPVSSINFEDNQQNSIVLDAYRNICESDSFPVSPSETGLTTIFCGGNNNNLHMSGMNHSPGFAYQLSPISVSSPSNASNVSSPGFLLSPHQELCHANVFEFNV